MDVFYRGLESSLLGLSFGLALTVAVLAGLPMQWGEAHASTTLPVIEVDAAK